jgi:hypothetical protein
MDYYNKYLKYKKKYLELKYEINITGREKEELERNYDNIFAGVDITDDSFTNFDNIKQLGDTNKDNVEFMQKLIKTVHELFYHIKHDNNRKLFNYDELVKPQETRSVKKYLKELKKLNLHIEEIKKHIEIITNDKGLDKTLFLIQGDSPTYFMYFIQVMYTEFYNSLNLLSIPISKLRNDEPNHTFINEKVNDKLQQIPTIEHIVIIDYSQSGCSSFKYSYDILVSNGKSITFFDLRYFFLEKLSDFMGTEIVPIKRESLDCDGEEFKKPYIDLFYYPYSFNENPEEFPIDYPEKLRNNTFILSFFVDDKGGIFGEDFRCQFSNKVNEGGIIKNPYNIKLCDLFKLYIYMLYTNDKFYAEIDNFIKSL